MGKKRSHPIEAPKARPKVEEEPVEVHVVIPRTEFPPTIKVIGRGGERSYSRTQLESLYEDACALSKTSGLANCRTWMEDLKIDFGAACWIMDIMEYRGRVKPIAPEESGPRKFTAGK